MTSFKLALIASSAALAAACSSPEAEMSGAHADTAQMPHGDVDHGAREEGAMASGEMNPDGMERAAMGAEGMDHGAMNHGAMAAAEATAPGVLNAIDVENSVVNLTHPPMPEIGWPEMAMDLPVTRAVDLSQFSAGDRVTFTVRRGRDDQFRIVAMNAAADE
jgi:Cu(I)/Ag(I) efflux system protein CusF